VAKNLEISAALSLEENWQETSKCTLTWPDGNNTCKTG
jgi:hypothetical protein